MKARATLQVPADAAFFGDHFPKRPVFPGTLLMNTNLKLVTSLAANVPARAGARWAPRAVVDMKLRDFISPGELLSIEAKVMRHEGDELKISVETRSERTAGSVGARRAVERRRNVSIRRPTSNIQRTEAEGAA